MIIVWSWISILVFGVLVRLVADPELDDGLLRLACAIAASAILWAWTH